MSHQKYSFKEFKILFEPQKQFQGFALHVFIIQCRIKILTCTMNADLAPGTVSSNPHRFDPIERILIC